MRVEYARRASPLIVGTVATALTLAGAALLFAGVAAAAINRQILGGSCLAPADPGTGSLVSVGAAVVLSILGVFTGITTWQRIPHGGSWRQYRTFVAAGVAMMTFGVGGVTLFADVYLTSSWIATECVGTTAGAWLILAIMAAVVGCVGVLLIPISAARAVELMRPSRGAVHAADQ